MQNFVLKPLIKKFKEQDMGVFPQIYENFKRLIFMYATRLRYEDAASDLNLFLIELLYGINLSHFKCDESFGINKYIAVSLRNKYVNLSIQRNGYINNTFPLFDDVTKSNEAFEDTVLINAVLQDLNDKQKFVLIYKYLYGYSDYEIGCILGITRQAVNGLKNRALAILKQLLTG